MGCLLALETQVRRGRRVNAPGVHIGQYMSNNDNFKHSS
jgi:hypothetical protein